MRSGIAELVNRIALFPRQSLIATKRSINYDRPSEEDLNKDVAAINELRVSPVAENLMTKFIGMTDEFKNNAFELGMPDDLVQLYE